ncbi:Hypothetical protein R9X50_00333500 [Acrodontium crateriforme]|uniref:Glycosyltransferase family 32 protein n=1 Tax=Acrodontium crateriforme TaxID=150365 RepID=A0AAQ3M5Z0_9PEZI|nr:Hypothetical protein R9X50_00333500 [Acrodontium crateriforme]
MRSKIFYSLAAVVFAIFLARHHFRDLIEVGRTYATYHTYIRSHPDVLYKYSRPGKFDNGNSSPSSRKYVPKIIHRIFLQEGRKSTLSNYRAGLESCRRIHPDWEQKIWTDENATEFMREHYPAIAPHYTGYAQSIQRANILRYALLDHFGGVYLDLDVTCLDSLDRLRHLPWLTPGAYPAGVNNAFILAKPGHPHLKELLFKVPSRNIRWPMPYVENMLSTGCMYFSNRFMSYARLLMRLGEDAPYEAKFFVLADQDGNMEPHMLRGAVRTPLFAHAGASSWHGWDAAMMVLIGQYYGYFALLLGMLHGTLFVGLVVLFRRSNRCTAWPNIRRSIGTETIPDHERLSPGKEFQA